jgi:hypothetical protein
MEKGGKKKLFKFDLKPFLKPLRNFRVLGCMI